jgi:chemotaxis protein MotB
MRSVLIVLICSLVGVNGCGVSRTLYEATSQDLMTARQELGKLQGALQEGHRRSKELEQAIEGFREKNQQLEMELQNSQGEQGHLLESLRLRIRDLDQKVVSLQEQNQVLLEQTAKQTTEIGRLNEMTKSIQQEKGEEAHRLKETYEELVKELEGEIREGAIKISQVMDRLSVNLVEKILFDSGSADIKPEGLKVLGKIGDAIKKVSGKEIRVEGHTDNVPVSQRIASRFPTNWELSTARATTVVRYLQEKQGIDPRYLTASAYASYRPIADNQSGKGRAQNRRIEIVLVSLDVKEVLQGLK